MNKLDITDLRDWKEHPITVELYRILNDNIDFLNEKLTNTNFICSADYIERARYDAGRKDICTEIIELTLDDFLIEEEIQENEENPSTMWG